MEETEQPEYVAANLEPHLPNVLCAGQLREILSRNGVKLPDDSKDPGDLLDLLIR